MCIFIQCRRRRIGVPPTATATGERYTDGNRAAGAPVCVCVYTYSTRRASGRHRLALYATVPETRAVRTQHVPMGVFSLSPPILLLPPPTPLLPLDDNTHTHTFVPRSRSVVPVSSTHRVSPDPVARPCAVQLTRTNGITRRRPPSTLKQINTAARHPAPPPLVAGVVVIIFLTRVLCLICKDGRTSACTVTIRKTVRRIKRCYDREAVAWKKVTPREW